MTDQLLLLKEGILKRYRMLLCLALFCATSITVNAQDITVTGVVSDDDGALPGATVSVVGTSSGTITDLDGNFKLSVPSDAVLQISYLGYTTQEIPVNGRTSINVSMKEDLQQLSEVVVVGYGSMERSNVTGSIVTVDVGEIEKTPIPNAIESLRGRVPGLQVTRGSGQPGSGVSFQIRGTNSLGVSNEPIIVIDGVPVPGGNINEINPQDIESMNILKDAAASAIYGSSGANGAILITTKSGKSGQTKFTVDYSTGSVELANELDIMNADQYVKYQIDSRVANGQVNPTVNNFLDPIELENYIEGTTADWQNLLIQRGQRHTASIGASGGSDKFSFYVNGDVYMEEGIVQASDYNRYSLRSNTEFKPNDWLTIGTRLQLTRSDADETSNVIDEFNINGGFAPYIPITGNSPLGDFQDENGNYSKFVNTDQFQINPLYRYQESQVDRIINRTYINPYVNIDFGGGFKYTLNTFAEVRSQFLGSFRSSDYADQEPSQAQIQNTTNKNYLIDNILTYSKTFGKHRVDATAVIGMQKFEFEQATMFAENLPTDLLGYNAIGDALDARSQVGWNTDENGRSYNVIRAGYGYDDRYNFTVSMRRDLTSKFGANYKQGYFPSVSFAWNAHNEGFFNSINYVSQFKVRASYGVLGNDNFGNYQYLARATNVQLLLGVDSTGVENIFNGYGLPNAASNPNLRWEESRQANIGIDFGFLKNRITGSVDIWQTNTVDLLLTERIIPVVGGYSTYPSNIGETENKGIDISLRGLAFESKDFSWNIFANLSLDRNKIVRLSRSNEDEDGNPIDNPANGWFIGQNINELFDYRYTGVWQLDEESEAAEFGATPGDPKIEDIDGNGVINDDDRTFLGNPTPSWYGGITNIVSYKGFEFSFLIEAVQGVTQVNSYIGGFTGRGNQLNINYWTPNNPTNEFPRIGDGNALAGGLFSNAIKVQDASFVALRNISFSYTLPPNLLENLPLNNVNFYVRGNNLKYWTDYKLAYSPESGSGSYPITRTWVIGARLTF